MQHISLNNINWTDLIQDSDQFELMADQCYRQYVETHDLDYTYVKNITVDSEYFSNLTTWEKNPFPEYIGKFRRDYTKEFNDTYKDILIASEPDYNSDVVKKLKFDLNLDEIYCLQQIQLPGALVAHHRDFNRGLSTKLLNQGIDHLVKVSNIRKYIVYLDDWALGQVFMCGRHAYTNWKKGDVMSFPWFMSHSTANTGVCPRPILFIAGVEF